MATQSQAAVDTRALAAAEEALRRRSWRERLSIGARNHWFPYALMAPSILVLVAFLVLPFFYLFYWSAFDYKIGVTNEYIGLDNYDTLFGEARFYENVTNSLIYIAGNLGISVPIAYFGALLVTSGARGTGVLRTFLLIPWVLAPIVTALLAKTLINPFDGPLIDVLAWLNGGEEIYPTTTDRGAMILLIAHSAWRSFPLIMLMLAAGMTSIDPQIYEAASVDGASRWQQFLRITLPLTKIPLLSGVVAITIFTLHDAEGAFALTGGGPGTATEVMGIRIFKEAFDSANLGMGAAVGVALVLITVVVLVFQNLVLGRDSRGSR